MPSASENRSKSWGRYLARISWKSRAISGGSSASLPRCTALARWAGSMSSDASTSRSQSSNTRLGRLA